MIEGPGGQSLAGAAEVEVVLCDDQSLLPQPVGHFFSAAGGREGNKTNSLGGEKQVDVMFDITLKIFQVLASQVACLFCSGQYSTKTNVLFLVLRIHVCFLIFRQVKTTTSF